MRDRIKESGHTTLDDNIADVIGDRRTKVCWAVPLYDDQNQFVWVSAETRVSYEEGVPVTMDLTLIGYA